MHLQIEVGAVDPESFSSLDAFKANVKIFLALNVWIVTVTIELAGSV